jgi:adenine phosphoribosyltransferase
MLGKARRYQWWFALSLRIHWRKCDMTSRAAHTIEIAGVTRHLPLFEIKPGVRIAILNILGDTELVQAAAKGLAKPLAERKPALLVTAEAKAIPIAHAIAVEMKLPYVVLRKAYKPYMGDALQSETLSITTGAPQTLFLDEKDRELVSSRKVALIDDVISTGSTLQGMRLIMQKAGAEVVAEAAILTEGDRAQWHNIIALGHIPVWVD